MNEVKVIGETKAGKKLAIRIAKGTPLWEFVFTKGGQVPKELGGLWHEDRARAAGLQYLNKDSDKAKKTKENS